jgi:hypothetical protein
MDWQTLINVGATGVVALLGWFLNGLASKHKEVDAKASHLERSLTDFRIKVAEDYVTIHDLVDIKNALIRIETKLDGKADRA